MKNLPEDAAGIDAVIGKIRQSVLNVQMDLKREMDVDPSATDIKTRWEFNQQNKTEAHQAKATKKKEDAKSVGKLVDAWIENLTYRPLTTKAVTNSLKKFKDFLLISGKAQVQDITRELIDTYSKWLFEKKKLSDSSHGRHMKHLRWFLKTL